jgi:hypothetical protein
MMHRLATTLPTDYILCAATGSFAGAVLIFWLLFL